VSLRQLTEITPMPTWRGNACGRDLNTFGLVGHDWVLFEAQVEGEFDPCHDETLAIGWYDPDQVGALAQRTIDYACGRFDDDAWGADPGIELTWMLWYMLLGIVDVSDTMLGRIEQMAARRPQ
jgi:hypothetical protein